MATVTSSMDHDPLVSYLFALKVDNRGTIGLFSNVTGLGQENAVVEHKQRTADGKVVIKKVPGQLSWDDITLKRGITNAKDLWEWRQDVVKGDMSTARSGGSIEVYDHLMEKKASWKFTNGWPSKWSGGDLDATSDEVFTEELTIVHEGLEWE